MLCLLLFLESIGTGELLLIMIFILFFFGSKKIPDLAKGLGKGMREMKDAVQGIERDLKDGINLEEEKKMIDDVKKDIQSTRDELK
ncbi:MAG TPA: twin-arginine translocase TatA/TatE family subunit [Bacteroidia bacterium]|nr:twin-arginine translocase TatA/TatE family subunit [Bacteroidia bacterium]